jgi:RNA polymerase sigma-70 factor (ECF subfamily)
MAMEAASAEGDYDSEFWPLYLRAYRTAMRLLGDVDAAEDVAAETLARAHQHWRKISRLPYREGWVARTAANRALDVAKRRRPDLTPGQLAATFDDRAADRVVLAAALRRLPRRQRESVTLHFACGLTHAEVAHALGLAEGTVRVHVHRGLTALRSQFKIEAPMDEEAPNA